MMTSRGVKCSPPPLLYRAVGHAMGSQVNATEGSQERIMQHRDLPSDFKSLKDLAGIWT
jgi:hypothetical protein